MIPTTKLWHKLTTLNYNNTNRSYGRFTNRKPVQIDPGIRKRKTLQEEDTEVHELADHDFDVESDFMNLGETHSDHLKQIKIMKQKQRFVITKQKYFKQNLPNFLTWSDKEQIRYLYRTDPEKWNADKLSEGFPASPEIISKIATSNWSKISQNSINNHDEAVKRNWKMLKEGKFNKIPVELVEHLNKFRNRDLNIKPFKLPDVPTTTKSLLAPNVQIGNEFSNIITSYERLKNPKSETLNLSKPKPIAKPPKEDTFMFKSKFNSEHLTLGKLQENIERKDRLKYTTEDEQIMLQTLEETNNRNKQVYVQKEEVSSVEEIKAKNSSVSVVVKNKKDYSHLDYPENIKIPKSLFKPGRTYKLNDCYYDDDGEFLYRVPGMH